MTELVCIVCPRGCHLWVDEENGYSVSGNNCLKGEEYGKNELINPKRIITSIVRIDGASIVCCPVKTSRPIPKALISDAMKALVDVRLSSPVSIGDVVVQDVCGTGSDWVVTRNL